MVMVPRLDRYFSAGIKIIRYEGVFSLFWRAVKKCLSPQGSLGIIIFYKKDLNHPLREIRSKVELSVTESSKSDIEQVITLKASREGRSEIELQGEILQRFRRGDKCFVGKIGTEIVHYNWISFHCSDIVAGRFIHLKNDEAFCYDGFTVEAWRGRAIHPEVNYRMLLHLQQTGYRRAYTHHEAETISSKKGLQLLRWESYGTILYFIPCRTRKCWIWRIKGSLDPFVEERIPPGETEQRSLQ